MANYDYTIYNSNPLGGDHYEIRRNKVAMEPCEIVSELEQSEIHKQLQAKYLDWVNNYLTIEKFAEHNELTITEAIMLVELGKMIHERYVSELKGV